MSAVVHVFCLSPNQFAASLGNTCPKIAKYIRSKLAVAAQVRKDAHFVSNEERQMAFTMQEYSKDEFVMP